MGQLQRLSKFLFSLFIIFQLAAIFILPNPESLVYRELRWPIVTYGNLFGFNTTWRFFSPNPLIRQLEYDVFRPDPDGRLQQESHRYPESLAQERFREIFNRKLTNGMFLAGQVELLKELLGPKLCSKHPGAESIGVWMKGRVFPTIENARFQGENRSEIGEVSRQYLTDIQCKDLE